jgi:hypothetical protein
MTHADGRSLPSIGFALMAAAVLVTLVSIPCSSLVGEEGQPVSASRQGDDAAGLASGENTKDEAPEKKIETKKEKKGPTFLPIPIFITEPAIGYGLGAALTYFHRSDGDGSAASGVGPAMTMGSTETHHRRQQPPPDVTGVAAGYTDKGSWFVGIGHSGSWAKDTIRYKGAIAYADLDAEFWFFNIPLDVDIAGAMVYQNLLFRIGDSDLFLGGMLTYLNTDASPTSDDAALPAGISEATVQDFGLGAELLYDTRDYTMTPNRGLYAELEVEKYFEGSLGDYDYWSTGVDLRSLHQNAHNKLVLGWRLKLDGVNGDPPFWAYPYITLRGVPALRYQNQRAGEIATELRWDILDRWAVDFFAGVGGTRGDVPLFEEEKGVVAGGIGGRYLYRPQDNLWVGVDLARGAGQWTFYVEVGQAWN